MYILGLAQCGVHSKGEVPLLSLFSINLRSSGQGRDMRGKQNKLQPQQSTHTVQTLPIQVRENKDLTEKLVMWQAMSNKAAGSRFYLESLDPGSKNK